jgi:DHA2 family multidrug resistance protein
MAFADVFLMLTAIFVALAALALFLRKPGAAGEGAGAGH